jgi:hypothetical protein
MAKHEHSLRIALLTLGDKLLSAAEQYAGQPTVVTVRRGSVRVRLEAAAEKMARLRAGDELGAMAGTILQALAEAGGEVESRKLARLAGYKYSANWRTTMRQLQERGLIVRGPDGYRLDTPQPTEEEDTP